MATPHRLVIVRHSKAEPTAATDAERRLTERGRRDAEAAGAWLAKQGPAPARALVSSAARTLETWELLSGAAGWEVETEHDDALYSADEDTVLDILATLDEGLESVVVVGHNPTVGMLAQLLDDGDGDRDAVDRLMLGYPTSAVTVFDVPVPWKRLGPGTATLAAFEVGRG